MLQKIFITCILSSLLLTSCDPNKASKEEEKVPIKTYELTYLGNSIKTTFSPQLIIIALEHIAPTGLLAKEMRQANHAEYWKKANALVEANPQLADSLLQEVSKRGENEPVSHKLYNWCFSSTTLKLAEHLDAPVFMDEVLDEIPISKKVIESMQTKGQTGGINSFSSTQLNELPFQLCTYLANADESVRSSFLQSYLISVGKRVRADVKP